MKDLLPDINMVSSQISNKLQEKADVERRIGILNIEISQLEERKEKIDEKITELTYRKYLFGRKQYGNPDIRLALIQYGEESDDHNIMELAFTVQEKDTDKGQLSDEMIDFLITLDNSLRAKNSNNYNWVSQLSKDEEYLEREVCNDN